MATRGLFARNLSDMFNYCDADRKALNDILKISHNPSQSQQPSGYAGFLRSKPILLTTTVCRLCWRNYRLLCVVVSF